MSRLIDANKLSEWIADQFCEDMPNHWDRTAEAILEHINEMPTVKPSLYGQCWGCQCEPTENKHGQWIWDGVRYHCSECFFHAYGNTLECLNGTYRFCPYCGATMDEVEE